MADWNAAQYLTFEDERTRPARDLLARVLLDAPARAVDLGCGPGNSTELIAARFPGAEVVGLDSSPGMIAAARARCPGLRFVRADLAAWRPEAAPDLIFANAVLQWLPDHAALMPRLAGLLAPRGYLAVQVPDNLDEPSHRLMREVAGEAPFTGALAGATGARSARHAIPTYYGWLTGAGCTVEAWRTTYVHALDGPEAVVEWVHATGLRPFLDPLDAAGRALFLERYGARIAGAYPRQADGRVLLPFPRLFLVARRA